MESGGCRVFCHLLRLLHSGQLRQKSTARDSLQSHQLVQLVSGVRQDLNLSLHRPSALYITTLLSLPLTSPPLPPPSLFLCSYVPLLSSPALFICLYSIFIGKYMHFTTGSKRATASKSEHRLHAVGIDLPAVIVAAVCDTTASLLFHPGSRH